MEAVAGHPKRGPSSAYEDTKVKSEFVTLRAPTAFNFAGLFLTDEIFFDIVLHFRTGTGSARSEIFTEFDRVARI
jgi:hypothetical protein